MARPCNHKEHVETCRICFWCRDPSAKGKAYRVLWNEPEPEPTLINKAWSFVTSVVTHAFVGERVSDGVYQHRLSICRGTVDTPKCANYLPDRQICQACGCNLGRGILDKALWKEQQCPVGKW